MTQELTPPIRLFTQPQPRYCIAISAAKHANSVLEMLHEHFNKYKSAIQRIISEFMKEPPFDKFCATMFLSDKIGNVHILTYTPPSFTMIVYILVLEVFHGMRYAFIGQADAVFGRGLCTER